MVTHNCKLYQFLQVFVSFLVFFYITPVLGNVISFKCMEKERQALFHLKDKLVDDYGRLSSWTAAKDCCEWEGVHCDNQTSHVTVLDLRGPAANVFMHKRASMPLRGMISPSLLELKQLNYLDLSFNDFSSSRIPGFIGSLAKLKYLNLSNTNFYGPIPNKIGNLSQLHFLDLGSMDLISSDNLDWLSNLPSLRYLDLSQVDLHKATNWLQAVGNLPFLQELVFYSCQLPQILPPFSFANSSASLSILDLSYNNLLPSSVYTWLFNFSSSLSYLELQYNNLNGNIPDAFGEMTSLVYLGLSHNPLQGGIPRRFGNLSNLESLDNRNSGLSGQLPEIMKNLSGHHMMSKLKTLNLGWNKIGGLFPDISKFPALTELILQRNQLNGFSVECCNQHSNLVYLDLSMNRISGSFPDFANFPYLREMYLGQNHLQGIMSESPFSKLSQLRTLSLSFNSLLVLNFSSTWFPPFQLNVVQLSSVKLGPRFPKWLQTQHNISYLDISATGISDSIPDWFWDISPSMTYLNLSHNQIYGMLPNLSSKFSGFPSIDLGYNNLTGPLPSLPPDIYKLVLSMNMFWGSLSVVCNTAGYLSFLDICHNLLSGELPNCFKNWEQLTFLNFANNRLVGKIHHSIGSSTNLKALHLRNNSFTGEIPTSLRRCTGLQMFDLGENNLSGDIPSWIGDSLPNLVLLSLRSNELHGDIPSNLCQLSRIQILDLSMNKLSGKIPKCVSNLTAMAQDATSFPTIDLSLLQHLHYNQTHQARDPGTYSDRAFIIWKGVEKEFRSILGLVKTINLSSNDLTGEIPCEISNLTGLLGLNLSGNSLSGSIPTSFGELTLLNFLDLSRNQISGRIPNNFCELSHLGVLNLSYNNLSGRIPPTPHLQTFDSSSYAGNSGLCGSPLMKPCPGDEDSKDSDHQANDEEEDEDKLIDWGFYVSLALGFIFGFWGVFYATTVQKPSWWYKITQTSLTTGVLRY